MPSYANTEKGKHATETTDVSVSRALYASHTCRLVAVLRPSPARLLPTSSRLNPKAPHPPNVLRDPAEMANREGRRPISSPLSSPSRRSSASRAPRTRGPFRRRSDGRIDFRPLRLQRPTSYDTLRGDFREMHPPRPPGSTVPHDYSELDADQPPEYASEREEDAHHHGVVHGAHITGRNTSPSSPVIMPLSPGYNPQTGFEAPYDSDPEYQAARRARSLDLGPDTGSDDELPRYDPGGASPPPAYVPRAHEDQRSNRSGVYSDQPLSVGPHSHASSFQGQPTHWDPGRPRASTFNGEHAGAPAEAGGGGRRRSSSSAREPFSVLSRVSA